jgi:hypothetical protein
MSSYHIHISIRDTQAESDKWNFLFQSRSITADELANALDEALSNVKSVLIAQGLRQGLEQAVATSETTR